MMSASFSGQSVSFQRKGPIVVLIKPKAKRLPVKAVINKDEVQVATEVLYLHEEVGEDCIEGKFASNQSDSSPVKDEVQTLKEEEVVLTSYPDEDVIGIGDAHGKDIPSSAQQVITPEYVAKADAVKPPLADESISRGSSPVRQFDDGWRLNFEQECTKYGLGYTNELGDCPLSSVTIEVVMSEDGESELSDILDDLQTDSEQTREIFPDSKEYKVKKGNSKVQIGEPKQATLTEKLRKPEVSSRGKLCGREVGIGGRRGERNDLVTEANNTTRCGMPSEKIHSPGHDGGISSLVSLDVSVDTESSPGATVPGWHPVKPTVVPHPVVSKPTNWNGSLRIPIRSRKYSHRRSSKRLKDDRVDLADCSMTTPQAMDVGGRCAGEMKPAGTPEGGIGDSNAVGGLTSSKEKVGYQRLPAMLLPKLGPANNVSGNVLAAGSGVVGVQSISACAAQLSCSSALQVKQLKTIDGDLSFPLPSPCNGHRKGKRVSGSMGKYFSGSESVNPKVQIPRLKNAGRPRCRKAVKTVPKTPKLASACVNMPVRVLNPSEMVDTPASVSSEIRSAGSSIRLVPASLPVGVVQPGGFVVHPLGANLVSQIVLPSAVGQSTTVFIPGQSIPKQLCSNKLSADPSTSNVNAGVSSIVQSSCALKVSQIDYQKNSVFSEVLPSAIRQSGMVYVPGSPGKLSAVSSNCNSNAGIDCLVQSSDTAEVSQIGNQKSEVQSCNVGPSSTVIVPGRNVPTWTSHYKVPAVSSAPKVDAAISSLVQSLVSPNGLGLKPAKRKPGVLSLSPMAPSPVKVVIQPALSMAEADSLISKGGQLKGVTDGMSDGPLVNSGPLVLYKVPANGNGGEGSGGQDSDLRQPVGYLIGGSALNLESMVYGSDEANARVRKRKESHRR